MKTIITLFLSILISISFGQNGYYIADTSKSWNIVKGGFSSYMVVCCVGTSNIKFEGDTLIDNKTYLKVFESSDSLQQNWEIEGFIYEDTILNTVFFRDFTDNEGLIYDFSIDIGDSIYIDNYYMGFTDALLICNEIDSIEINGTYKTRYYFFHNYPNPYIDDIWIEDIGSMDGILNSGMGASCFVGGFRDLLCYSENDTLIYQNPIYDECYKVEFYPKITSEYFDTAYCNTYYEFQIQISDTNYHDSISWRDWFIPGGFSLDGTTGIIIGYPTSTGSFPCIITVNNWGYNTDIIESNIVVINPTDITTQNSYKGFQIFPNPCINKLLIILELNKNEEYLLEIYNLNGILIDQLKMQGKSSKELNCRTFKNGTYFFNLMDKNKKIISKRQIVIN